MMNPEELEKINQLEQEKYHLLNRFFYLVREGTEANAVGDTEKENEIADEVVMIISVIATIDDALEYFSEIENYDYEITISTKEV